MKNAKSILKKIIAAAILLLGSYTLFGQEIIVTVNGDTAKVIVQQVTPDRVLYTRYDNPEGSTFELNKSRIYSLTYLRRWSKIHFCQIRKTTSRRENPAIATLSNFPIRQSKGRREKIERQRS